jgi:hypothetical protein
MSASVRLMIQGHSVRRASSRVRQCHQLIKISEIKSEAYTCTQKPVYTRAGAYTHPLCIHTTARVNNAPTRVYADPGVRIRTYLRIRSYAPTAAYERVWCSL